MGGQSFNFPPPPSISLRQISEFFRLRARLVPGYSPRDFGNSAGNVAGDIVDFILAPGPRVCIMAQAYKTESFILLGVHHVWNLSRPPQALPPQKLRIPGPPTGEIRGGGQNFNFPLPLQFPYVPIFGMFHDWGRHHFPRFRRFL